MKFDILRSTRGEKSTQRPYTPLFIAGNGILLKVIPTRYLFSVSGVTIGCLSISPRDRVLIRNTSMWFSSFSYMNGMDPIICSIGDPRLSGWKSSHKPLRQAKMNFLSLSPRGTKGNAWTNSTVLDESAHLNSHRMESNASYHKRGRRSRETHGMCEIKLPLMPFNHSEFFCHGWNERGKIRNSQFAQNPRTILHSVNTSHFTDLCESIRKDFPLVLMIIEWVETL